jgi:hypothetical protein
MFIWMYKDQQVNTNEPGRAFADKAPEKKVVLVRYQAFLMIKKDAPTALYSMSRIDHTRKKRLATKIYGLSVDLCFTPTTQMSEDIPPANRRISSAEPDTPGRILTSL